MKIFIYLIFVFFLISCNTSVEKKIATGSISAVDCVKIKENRLYCDSMAKNRENECFKHIHEIKLEEGKFESYRFMLVEAFKNDIMLFRIEKKNGNIILVVKTFIPKKMDNTGKDTLLSTYSKRIKPKDWDEFKHLLEQANFWKMAYGKDEGKGSFDGSAWKLEGYIPSADTAVCKFHVVQRYCPQSGNFRKACMKLITLYGKMDTTKIHL